MYILLLEASFEVWCVIDEVNKFETARNNTQHVAKLPAAKSQFLAFRKVLKMHESSSCLFSFIILRTAIIVLHQNKNSPDWQGHEILKLCHN